MRMGVRDVLRQQRCDMVFLLESKLEKVSEDLVASLWFLDSFEFSFEPSVGASGGIVVIWEVACFRQIESEVLLHAVVVCGRWLLEEFDCGLVAVYAPCGGHEQREVWDMLESFLSAKVDRAWCVAGDFNVSRFGGLAYARQAFYLVRTH
ncbi:hypothetical protein GQ457_06G018410 [Hibiscus cannabinus]